jgi:hypothetical protein
MYSTETLDTKSSGYSSAIEAIQYVRRMRGGAQSHLLRCTDGELYVVKFQNNPQHRRVLVNELLGTCIARDLGLPVPDVRIVETGQWLIDHTPQLSIELVHGTIQCRAGRQVGSRYVLKLADGLVFDHLPENMLNRLRNKNDFAGILAFDKWTLNADGRQAAFWRKRRERKFTATFIDQGYCFNGGEWTFKDSPLRGVYGCNGVYSDVRGWKDFEPWLTRIINFDESRLRMLASQIPVEWYEDTNALETLVEQLLKRRTLVPELIMQFKNSSRHPFALWNENYH